MRNELYLTELGLRSRGEQRRVLMFVPDKEPDDPRGHVSEDDAKILLGILNATFPRLCLGVQAFIAASAAGHVQRSEDRAVVWARAVEAAACSLVSKVMRTEGYCLRYDDELFLPVVQTKVFCEVGDESAVATLLFTGIPVNGKSYRVVCIEAPEGSEQTAWWSRLLAACEERCSSLLLNGNVVAFHETVQDLVRKVVLD